MTRLLLALTLTACTTPTVQPVEVDESWQQDIARVQWFLSEVERAVDRFEARQAASIADADATCLAAYGRADDARCRGEEF